MSCQRLQEVMKLRFPRFVYHVRFDYYLWMILCKVAYLALSLTDFGVPCAWLRVPQTLLPHKGPSTPNLTPCHYISWTRPTAGVASACKFTRLAESPPDSLATQGPIHPQPHPVPLHFMDPPHSKHRICLQQSPMHPCFAFIAACAYYTVVQVVP